MTHSFFRLRTSLSLQVWLPAVVLVLGILALARVASFLPRRFFHQM